MTFTSYEDATPEQQKAAAAQFHEIFQLSKLLGETLDLANGTTAARSEGEAAIDHLGSMTLEEFHEFNDEVSDEEHFQDGCEISDEERFVEEEKIRELNELFTELGE